MLIKLTGGRIYDPANSVSGAVRDIYVEDGKIIAARPDARAESDDGPLDHRAGLDPGAVEDDRAVEPCAGADLGAAPDHGAADQQ